MAQRDPQGVSSLRFAHPSSLDPTTLGTLVDVVLTRSKDDPTSARRMTENLYLVIVHILQNRVSFGLDVQVCEQLVGVAMCIPYGPVACTTLRDLVHKTPLLRDVPVAVYKDGPATTSPAIPVSPTCKSRPQSSPTLACLATGDDE